MDTNTLTQVINWFSLAYVGIPLMVILVLFLKYIAGKPISNEKLEILIKVGQWYLISVAVVFAAKILETGFTERETGLKEMQVYNEYVGTILEADNIEARWKLAEYFSTVTPTDRLRERWIAYKNLIEEDYIKFKELEAKEKELLAQESLTADDKVKLNNVQGEIFTFQQKLVGDNLGRWVVVFTADTDLEQSNYELNNLIKAGIEDPKIYFRNNSYRTISKTFSSRQEANNYVNVNRVKIRKDAYIVNLDRWCPNEVFNGEFYECE